jgi:hypothetical protein
MNRCVLALFFLLALVAAEKKTLRQRRNVLEVETKEKAAELLDSLWVENGIKTHNNRKLQNRKLQKGSTESKSSKSMSFYYY